MRRPIDPRTAIGVRTALGFAVLVAVQLAPSARAQATLAAPLAPPTRVADWQPLIAEASARFGVPIPWIVRVMSLESAGRTHRNGLPIRSKAGAMGLMQMMPATWMQMRAALGLGDDPDDPRDNIMAGTAYLRLMYDRFGYPGLFAAYNAGPARYAASLASGRPLPAETRTYLLHATLGTIAPDAGGEDPAGLVRLASATTPTSAPTLALASHARHEAGLFFTRTPAAIPDASSAKLEPNPGQNSGPAPSLFALRRAQP